MSGADDKKPASRKKAALGRGLSALLGDDLVPQAGGEVEPADGERVLSLPLESIEPNPYQPRRVFDDEALTALAESIREHGVLQPLVVRPAPGGYQLVAGERRFRACHKAGLTHVPVVVREATDQQALLLALLENLQREDLGCMEEAQAYQRLASEFELTQEAIAQGVGKDRSTVANCLRLLKLPDDVRDDLASGRLSAGHGRALLHLDTPAKIRAARDKIVSQGLSVRGAEALVRALNAPPKPKRQPAEEKVHLDSLAADIHRRLGAKVEIKRRGKKGSIVIRFASDEELERLLEHLR